MGILPLLAVPVIGLSLWAQDPSANSGKAETTLRTYSRAVLVDVLVTDRHGKPVTGLKQDQFSVTEQGKPQAITFFEEHTAVQSPPVALPKLPPGVFTNFSPNPLPAAVNVLLLDSLNTQMENQSFVHKQAVQFLKTAKPGTRMAIFAMDLNLHFIQGFTDDPALLVAALGNAKNNEVQSAEATKTPDETRAERMLLAMMAGGGANGTSIAATKHFFQENDDSRTIDRSMITLANLQRLATFLDTFPGRKNLIWFTEGVPWVISGDIIASGTLNQQLDEELKKTLNMLASARVAVYPIDARGVSTNRSYQADNVIPGGPGIGTSSIATGDTQEEDRQRNSDQLVLEKLAQDTGGRAFANSNGLAQITADITSASADFYTLSYVPANSKIDGAYRKIRLKVSGDYNLSYRRGYFAIPGESPGSGEAARSTASKGGTPQSASRSPLDLFMDPGMPQNQQILYEARIQPKDETSATASKSGKKLQNIYTIDFAVDRKDLDLRHDDEGNYKDKLNLCLMAYDRYGNIVGRNDQVITLDLNPDTYALFANVGVQVHAEIAVPKGQLWLRTGIYDQRSRKVGTMEIELSSVKSPSDSR